MPKARTKHPAKGKVGSDWLEYIPAYKVGDRFKDKPEYKTIWEVLEVVERGCVCAVFESPLQAKGTHKSLWEWMHLAHTHPII